MLGSISPVGEASRGQRWWLTAGAYTVASTLAGAATGLLLGALGAALATVVDVSVPGRLFALGAVVLLGALVDARLAPLPLPTVHRQVDERWLTTYRGWIYGAGFGLQLGTGVVTIVVSAATYSMLVAALLTMSAGGGLIVGAAFGIVRSLPLLLTARLRTPARLYETTRRIAASEPLAHRITVAGQLSTAALALVAGGIALQ